MGHGLQGKVIRTSKLNLDLGSQAPSKEKRQLLHDTVIVSFLGEEETQRSPTMLSRQSTGASIKAQCWESTLFAPESMPSPILIGTADIVKDTAQESPAKSHTICSKWGKLLTHWHKLSSFFSAQPFLYQSQELWIERVTKKGFSCCDIFYHTQKNP